MKKSRFVKATLAACVVAACVFALAACSNSDNPSSGVAATVNGTEIPEQKVTDQVAQIREQSGIEDEEQWGKFLVQNDMTPSSVRDQIIDTLTEQEVIMQGAASLDITVEDSEIEEYINNMKGNYDSDEAWVKALDQAGFTEDSYREEIRESLYEQKVGDYFEDKAEVTDEDNVTSAQTYASYYDGAKRSSHILIGVDDTSDEAAMDEAKEKAEGLIEQINGGADFAELAKENSTDESSAENGGDVGWDKLNSFVTEYTDALENLELNQVSEPVTSQYGVHVIKVTEVYTAPEDSSTITSLDQIPEAFRENIKEMAVSVKANSDYTDWLDEQKENADIQKNDMPEGLPYDIDLTPYQEEEDAEDADEEATDDEAVIDEATDEDADAVVDETTGEDADAVVEEVAEEAEGDAVVEDETAQVVTEEPEGAEAASAEAEANVVEPVSEEPAADADVDVEAEAEAEAESEASTSSSASAE